MTTACSSIFRKGILAAIAAAITLVPASTSGYSIKTHPRLTERAVQFYLEQNNNNNQVDPEALKLGSVNEDSPDIYIRSYNHFQNWEDNSGLWGFSSAADWAEGGELQRGQVPLDHFLNTDLLWTKPLKVFYEEALGDFGGGYPFGDQSWQQAIKNNNQQALGHIAHLEADLTVPAHVRMDPHAFLPAVVRQFADFELHEDSYEIWAANYPGAISELTPTQIPNYGSLRTFYDETSHFTGAHFSSDNRIDTARISSLERRVEDGATYYYDTIDGKDVPIARKGFLMPYVLDWRVLEEQWKISGTKGVEGIAGIITLYFEITNPTGDCIPNPVSHCVGNNVYVDDNCGNDTLYQQCGNSYSCQEGECNPISNNDYPDAGSECTPNPYLHCVDLWNAIFRNDRCGLDILVQQCTPSQTCQTDRCVTNNTCTPSSTLYCVGNSVYNNDGCGHDTVVQNCDTDQTCQSGSCRDNPPAEYVDSNTRLHWQVNVDRGPIDEYSAESYCQSIGWRLPTISELRSLIRGCATTVTGGSCEITNECNSFDHCNTGCQPCATGSGPDNGCYWPNQLQGTCSYYWTSTVDTFDTRSNWMVGFRNAQINSHLKGGSTNDEGSHSHYVRCVK